MNVSIHPFGTPMSTGNAFDWRKPVEAPKPMTARQRYNAKQAEYEKEKYAKEKARKAATRVNPESYIASPADAAKTAKLIGKRNSARSE